MNQHEMNINTTQRMPVLVSVKADSSQWNFPSGGNSTVYGTKCRSEAEYIITAEQPFIV